MLLTVTRTAGLYALKHPDDMDVLRNYMGLVAKLTALAGKLRLVPSTRDPRKDDRGSDPALRQKTKARPGFFGE